MECCKLCSELIMGFTNEFSLFNFMYLDNMFLALNRKLGIDSKDCEQELKSSTYFCTNCKDQFARLVGWHQAFSKLGIKVKQLLKELRKNIQEVELVIEDDQIIEENFQKNDSSEPAEEILIFENVTESEAEPEPTIESESNSCMDFEIEDEENSQNLSNSSSVSNLSTSSPPPAKTLDSALNPTSQAQHNISIYIDHCYIKKLPTAAATAAALPSSSSLPPPQPPASPLQNEVSKEIQFSETSARPDIEISNPNPEQKKSTTEQILTQPSKPKVYKCEICQKILATEIGLRRHMLRPNKPLHQKAEMKYKCLYCIESFQALILLEKHSRTAHPEELPQFQFKCTKEGCSRSFKSSKNFHTHLQSHKSFKCDHCSKYFSNLKSLTSHILQDHKDAPTYKCELSWCAKTTKSPVFRTTYELQRHARNHVLNSQKSRFICPEKSCGQGFGYKKQYKKHIQEAHLKAKFRYHDGSYMVHCKYCMALKINCSKASAPIFRKHELAAHADLLIHNCLVFGCGEKYSSKEMLEAHSITHKEKAPFGCIWCPEAKYIFESGPELQTHLSNHHFPFPYRRMHLRPSDQSFTCNECGRGFLTNWNLSLHKRKHQREKAKQALGKESEEGSRTQEEEVTPTATPIIPTTSSFKCEICPDRNFKRGTHLINHLLKSHEGGPLSGENTLFCEKCGKGFVTQFLYNRHLKYHKQFDSSKPLACELCDVRYYANEQTLLDKHMGREHRLGIEGRQKPHPCRAFSCSKVCKSIPELVQHHKLSHPELFTFICPFQEGPEIEEGGEGPCNATFSIESFYKTHLKTHSNVGPYDCDSCKEKSFLSKDFLAQHLKKHLGQIIQPNGGAFSGLKCDKCPFEIEFANISKHKSIMTLHKIEKHGEDWPFKCSICDRGFARKFFKDNHERKTHSTEPSHQPPPTKTHPSSFKVLCELCGGTFSNVSMRKHQKFCLKKNESILEGKKPKTPRKRKKYPIQTCYFCSKTFSSKSGFQTHLRIHTKEKPYPCSKCRIRFHNLSLCKRHFKKAHPESNWNAKKSIL